MTNTDKSARTPWTPGPWRVTGRIGLTVRDSAAPSTLVASCHWRDGEANARLIAAAPALVDALARLVSEVEGILPIDADGPVADAYEEARAALAKVQP